QSSIQGSTILKGTMDYHIAKRPLNNDVFCGDTGIIKEFDNKVFVGVVDVLGHGEEAHEVAAVCEDFFQKNYYLDLAETLKGLHEHIKGSRGAVVGLSLLDLESGELQCTAMGNITIRKFGSSNTRIISREGIVGYIMSSPRIKKVKLYDGDVLVLYTDGVKEHFDQKDYPELLAHDARTIATRIMDQFGKEHDDALCIVLKYTRTGTDGDHR
ncbi:MAG: serine/threonine-protein phosphatase, partial [Desulfobacterales bacterium]|nr:serine/threonine-protein phosphatase [Desulfobacterales bacterium]